MGRMTERLRNFFKFYGSKWRIAPKYPAPRYPLIVEPFAGSASYSTLHYDRRVLLCETDLEVAALWGWLIATPAKTIRALPVGLPEGLDLRTLDVPHGGRLLIRYNQRVGQSRCWTVSKWGSASGFWTKRIREQVARQADQIRHWRVWPGSLLDQDPATLPEATWFLDPPYQTQAKVYGDPPDFERLADWARRLRGQVIVCEAPGATWLPFRPLCETRAGPTGAGGGKASQELIWTND